MTHSKGYMVTPHTNKGKRTLQRLRREAGFKTAKDFAAFLGIPESTYARYEQLENDSQFHIPMKAAWIIADVLGCSIDLIVGRASIDEEENTIEYAYKRLSKSGQERMEEYLQFLFYRDQVRGIGSGLRKLNK